MFLGSGTSLEGLPYAESHTCLLLYIQVSPEKAWSLPSAQSALSELHLALGE